jgi:hypothetical protein
VKENKMTQNIKVSVDEVKKVVTVVIDYKTEPKLSKSGNSLVFASTEGNQKVGDKDGLVLGLNLYRKKE